MKRTSLFVLLAVATTTASAQSIKPHPLGAVAASSKEVLGSITLARHLPNGGVIVNDQVKRRLLLLDPTLQTATVIADSSSGAVNSYGARPGALIPYIADSTLYLDVTAGSFLVIDPAGKVTRVMSTPRPNDNAYLTSTSFGYPGFDAKGRLVYRTNVRPPLMQTRDGGIQQGTPLDSQPVVRVDLDTRKADTVGAVKVAKQIMNTIQMPGGGMSMVSSTVPLPMVDDWSLLSDGSIAFLRGQDYHIDWILPDGSKKSTERVSFDWKRMTDDEKLAYVDSVSKAMAARQNAQASGGGPMIMSFGDGGGGAVRQEMMTKMVMGADAPPPAATGGGRGAPPAATASAPPAASSTAGTSGSTTRTTTAADGKAATAVDPKGGAPAGPAAPGGASAAGAPAGFSMPSMPTPVAADLPDYRPVFAAGAARPDADANLWVRTSAPGAAPGNLIYDVINNKGQLADRVEVPSGMAIVGFGKGGIVYLTQRDAAGVRLVRATVH